MMHAGGRTLARAARKARPSSSSGRGRFRGWRIGVFKDYQANTPPGPAVSAPKGKRERHGIGYMVAMALILLCACGATIPTQGPATRVPNRAPDVGTEDPIDPAGLCDSLDGPHTRRNRTVVVSPGVTIACF